jgi:D-alanyl-lipoteichoic acid acyltransferase DltB (MBOAT superfamily)
MLFNSYVFIFLFLPITLLGFALLGGRRLGVAWLVACSMFYYGYWSLHYLQLLLASMTVNYLIGTVWLAQPSRWARRSGLITGLAFNLAALFYFKYTNLIISTANSVAGAHLPLATIILPLGISFFTFQKIAYLVDVYNGRGYSRNFLYYGLFVLFFPQLIAGPIVHPREVLPQFSRRPLFGITARNLSVGLTLFVFGLGKKVLISDTLGRTATVTFENAAAGRTPGLTNAWLGAMSYALQIYFDFSGYSDMAIGLARLFGVRLPVNFNSPYKAANIVEFWRRWHITLSRFLRDYLYIPLGGSRRGKTRRYVNLMITMLLGGLWHGANWTYVVWGGLHGLYLCINHGYAFVRGASTAAAPRARLSTLWSGPLTFLAVVVAWVFFRADTFGTAGRMLGAMCGLNGLRPQEFLRSHLRWPMVLAALALCVGLPNSQQVMSLARPALGVLPPPPGRQSGRLLWRPTVGWALFTAAIAIASILCLSRPSEFIYYQF